MPSLSGLIDELADRHPRDPAFVESNGNRSFTELRQAVSAAAAVLANHGVAPGDRVAVAAAPGVQTVHALLGAMCCGAISCPLNRRWPAEQIRQAVNQLNCRAMIADDPVLDTAEGDVLLLRPSSLMGSAADAWPHTSQETDPAVIIFTSGSSGVPKAVVHSFATVFTNACASNQNIRLQPGDRWLLSLPIYHVSGLGIVFRCLASGAAITIPDPDADLGNTVMRLGITHLSLVPTQLQRMIATSSGRRAAKRLDAILLGGSAIPASLLHDCAQIGLPIHTTYGLSEMASQVTTSRPGASVHEWFTSGRSILADNIGLSSHNEILVGGESLFLGYWEDGAVKPAANVDGWFATGDIGRFDKDGNLIVTGRRDNMFVSGGENVYPDEIERALCRLMGIAEAVAVPVVDDEYGHRAIAFVRMADDTPFDADVILDEVRSALPSYALPKSIRPWPEDVPEGMKTDRRFFQSRI